jgi:hypothetical protein
MVAGQCDWPVSIYLIVLQQLDHPGGFFLSERDRPCRPEPTEADSDAPAKTPKNHYINICAHCT